MNKATVMICGKEYKLNTMLDPKYLNEIAQIIDKKFKSAFSEDKNLTLFDAAVLISMEVVDESVRSSKDVANMRSQVTKYSQEIDELKEKVRLLNIELNEQKQINQKLKAEQGLKDLKNHIEHMETL